MGNLENRFNTLTPFTQSREFLTTDRDICKQLPQTIGKWRTATLIAGEEMITHWCIRPA